MFTPSSSASIQTSIQGVGLESNFLNGPAASARIKYGFSKAHRLQPLRVAETSNSAGPRLDPNFVMPAQSQNISVRVNPPSSLLNSTGRSVTTNKKMQIVELGLGPSSAQLVPLSRTISKQHESVASKKSRKLLNNVTSRSDKVKGLCPIDGYVVQYVMRVFNFARQFVFYLALRCAVLV